jgi:hypothetical protein
VSPRTSSSTLRFPCCSRIDRTRIEASHLKGDDGCDATPHYPRKAASSSSSSSSRRSSSSSTAFHARDIDAEDWIVGAVRDFLIAAPLKLVLHLPANDMPAARALDLERALAS